MTVAVLEAPRTGTAIHRQATRPTHVVVLVSPLGGLSSCRRVMSQLTTSGAVVFAEEVDSVSPNLDADCAGLGDVVWTISNTLHRATKEFPGLPVVLVGHASTAAGALAFTELYPDECTGLVFTEQAAA